MKAGYLRFFLPVIFAVAGISGAFYFVMDLSRTISLANPGYDLIDPYPGRLPADAVAVVTWVIPISILVFILFYVNFGASKIFGFTFNKF